MRVLALAIALVPLLKGPASAEEKVYVTYLIEHNYIDYMEVLDGRDPLEIEDLTSVAPTRITAENLLLQVAPVLGGCNCRIEYRPYQQDTNHARTIEQVRSGFDITHGIAGFTGDSRYSDGISLSNPILDPGDFFVGLYTHEHRADVLSIADFDQISQLDFAVGNNWEVDLKVLAQYGFNAVPADSWNSLISMLIQERADVVMQPFTANDDLSFVDTVSKERFVPIPGVRLPFPQARHYMVSDSHPDGPAFLEALNRGLNILEEDGVLRAAMIHAGVINEQVQAFRVFEQE